ncbi:MAG: hypothetical protein WAT98_02530, partial [Blautia wexlerae]
GGCHADAAFLVGDGDDLRVHRISPRFCLSCLVLEIEKAATTFLKKRVTAFSDPGTSVPGNAKSAQLER